MQQGSNSAPVIEFTARKKRYIVPKPDKFFSQVRNDPLSAAIETRRDALNERSNLCDLHDDLVLSATNTNACSAAKFLSRSNKVV